MLINMRRAGAGDVGPAAVVLADAFADYSWTRWTVSGDDHRERVRGLQQLFMERVALHPPRAALEGDRFDASTEADAHVARVRPVTPHYYLGAVGTRRAHQRHGLGSAVLTPVMERAAATGVDVFLETSAPDNVEFYLRLGFVTMAESTVAQGGPHVWSMIRKHPV